MSPAAPLIMIVDDDELFVESMTALLTEVGYATVSCMNSTEAYRLVLEQRPDLVILDLQLRSRVSGIVLLDLLRLDPITRQTPVIICSGATSLVATTERRLRRQGCTIVEKPFTIDLMLEKVQEAVGPPG